MRFSNAAHLPFQGYFQASDEDQCHKYLQTLGLTVQALRAVPAEKSFWRSLRASWRGVQVLEVAIFVRQLATMLQAGVALSRGLVALSHAPPGTSPTQLNHVADLLEGGLQAGHRLSEVMQLFPQQFPPSVVKLVKVGERSGQLAECLERGATLLEKSSRLQQQVHSALVYPAFILTVFGLLGLLVACFVLPRFGEVLIGLNALKSGPVLWLFQLFTWLSQAKVLGLGVELVVLGASLLPMLAGHSWVRSLSDHLLLKVGIVRRFLGRVTLVQLSYTMNLLLDSGVGLAESLIVAADSCSSPRMAQALRRAHQRIQLGQSLSQSLAQEPLFPRSFSIMLASAEEAGAYGPMLHNLRALYEDEIDITIRTLTSLLEPLIIAAMGIFVGGFILIMLLPMAQLFQSLGQ